VPYPEPVEGRAELQAVEDNRRALAAAYGLNPKTHTDGKILTDAAVKVVHDEDLPR